MLVPLIAALQRTRLDMTAKEIADMLWLASHMKMTQEEINPLTAETPSQDHDGTTVSEFEQLGSPEQTVPSPSNTDDSVDVHAATHQSDAQSDIRGFPFRSPAASALPNTLLLARALRPFDALPAFKNTICVE